MEGELEEGERQGKENGREVEELHLQSCHGWARGRRDKERDEGHQS